MHLPVSFNDYWLEAKRLETYPERTHGLLWHGEKNSSNSMNEDKKCIEPQRRARRRELDY